MKTINSTLAALALLGFASAAHADLIKQNAAHYKDVLVTDTSGNNVLGLTTASFTATASINGGARTTITTPTITESGQGHYWVLEPPALTGTVGILSLVLTTASGTVQTDSKDDIVPDLPGGSVASVTSPVVASAVTGPVGSVTGSVGSVTGSVGSVSAPVVLASTQSFNNTGQTTNPAWIGISDVFLPGELTKLTAASTAQQAGSPVTLPPTAPAGYGGGSGGTATLSTGDEAKLTLASTAQQAGQPVTLPSTVLSAADLLAVQQAIMTYALHTGVSYQKAVAQIYLTTSAPVAPTKTGTVSTNAFKWPDGTTGQTSTLDSSTNTRTETPGTLPN